MPSTAHYRILIVKKKAKSNNFRQKAPIDPLRFHLNLFKIRAMEQVKNVDDAFAQLAWQVEAGADEAIDEQAGMLHWQAGQRVPEPSPVPSLPEVSVKKPPPAPRPKPTAAMDKPPESVKATSFEELRAEIDGFTGCNLKEMAMNTVFADGNPEADIMIIGDAPAEADDRQGVPFVGAHGQLMDKMLASIGLDRRATYLTNMIFWRPPGGRTPTQEEIDACLPFTQQHIKLAEPKLIICFGAAVARNLLREKAAFSKLRGKWFDYTPPLADEGSGQIQAIVTHPPSNLLRLPAQKRQAWQDLLKIKSHISN